MSFKENSKENKQRLKKLLKNLRMLLWKMRKILKNQYYSSNTKWKIKNKSILNIFKKKNYKLKITKKVCKYKLMS